MPKQNDVPVSSSQGPDTPVSTVAHEEIKKDITALRKLVEKQTEIIEGIHKDNKKIKSRLFFIVLGSNIRFIIFLIPLVLAFIYVVPFVRENWERAQSLLNITDLGTEKDSSSLFNQFGKQGVDVSQLLQQLQNQQ